MKTILMGLGLAIGITQSAAAASFTVFTDRTAFEAATSNTSLETFNSVVGEPSFNGADLTVGDLTLRNDSGTRGFIDQPPVQFAEFDIDGTAIASILTQPGDDFSLGFAFDIFAFGADFGGMNDGFQRSVFDILGENILAPVQNGQTIQFFGVVSDMAFSSLTIASFDGANDGFGMDNVIYGGVAAVPLPASLLLLLGGLGLLGGVRRRA